MKKRFVCIVDVKKTDSTRKFNEKTSNKIQLYQNIVCNTKNTDPKFLFPFTFNEFFIQFITNEGYY